MSPAVLSAAVRDVDVKRLDDLLAALTRYGGGELLLEHLQSARAYLLGAMPVEYIGSLEAAKDVSGTVADKRLRRMLDEILEFLLAEVNHAERAGEPGWRHQPLSRPHASAPAGARSGLWQFFSSEDRSFGVFYPRRHIIAVFPAWEDALQAAAELKRAGFGEQEVLVFSGLEMLQFLEEFRLYEGIWGVLMTNLSRLFATEAAFVDTDIRLARSGAAFLAIYCPTDSEIERIRRIVTPIGPLSMERYLSSGIQSLV